MNRSAFCNLRKKKWWRHQQHKVRNGLVKQTSGVMNTKPPFFFTNNRIWINSVIWSWKLFYSSTTDKIGTNFPLINLQGHIKSTKQTFRTKTHPPAPEFSLHSRTQSRHLLTGSPTRRYNPDVLECWSSDPWQYTHNGDVEQIRNSAIASLKNK